MKKRTLQLISLLLLFCMAGSLFACQKEEPSHRGGNLIEEGIKPSKLFYVENAFFDSGKIYYTLVNNKNEKTTVSDVPPDVEKWDGEKWVISYLTNKEDGAYWEVEAYSETTLSFPVDRSPQGAAGQYRLSFGYKGRTCDENGTLCYVYDPERTYTVFYVTIPEEGEYTATPAPARLKLDAELIAEEGVGHKLRVTLHNLSDKPFELLDQEPDLEFYENQEKGTFFTSKNHLYEYETLEKVTVAPGESVSCTHTLFLRNLFAEEKLPVIEMESGRYRVAVWGSFEGGGKIRSPYCYFDWSKA